MVSGQNVIIEAGYDLIFYSLLDGDGYPLGGTGVAVAGNANGSPALRLDGAMTVDLSIPDLEYVTPLGDDVPMVQFSFQSANLPNGALEVAATDLVAEARFSDVEARTVMGDSVQVLRGIANDKADVFLICQRQAKSWQAGFKGVDKRGGVYVPSCTLAPLGSAFTQRQHNPNRYGIAVSNASRTAWGETFDATTDGASTAPVVAFSSTDPWHQHAFRGNASATAFTLAYTPLNPSTDMMVTIEGVLQTYTTHYTVSGKVITFGSPPASNARIIVTYKFSRSELA